MEENDLLHIDPYLFIRTDLINYLSVNTADLDPNIYITIQLCQTPIDKNTLINDYKISPDIIDLLLKHNVIIPYEQIWKQDNFNTLDIEINTHCNYRCIYCPEKFTPKEPRLMSNELFSNIIDKTQRFPSITTIAFNFFNEPLLDPEFLNKIEIVSKTNLKVNLFTNGSLLDPCTCLLYTSMGNKEIKFYTNMIIRKHITGIRKAIILSDNNNELIGKLIDLQTEDDVDE